MEKYGVVHEYRCDCGYCVILRDNEMGPDMVKEAGKAEEGHKHTLKEADDGRGPDPSPSVRPE